MDHQALSLDVVGINCANADGVNRRFELVLCAPGDPVRLRLEPTSELEDDAVAVFSERGVQLGYLAPDQAPLICSKIRAGEPVAAIFQELMRTVASIRVRFDGERPALPPLRDRAAEDMDFEAR